MKTITYIFLFAFISVPTFVSTQVHIGIQGQINNMSTPLIVKRDLLSKPQGSTLNPGFGLFLEFMLSERFALQPEVNYQEQRKSFLLTGNERSINISTIEYIRIPVLLKYNIHFKNWNLVGLIGPNGGYGIRLTSGETNENLEVTSYEQLSFPKNEVRKFDIGILAGIGIEKFIANRLRTNLSIRYYQGVVDIMKADKNTFRNSGYILNMGFTIPLQSSDQNQL